MPRDVCTIINMFKYDGSLQLQEDKNTILEIILVADGLLENFDKHKLVCVGPPIFRRTDKIAKVLLFYDWQVCLVVATFDFCLSV